MSGFSQGAEKAVLLNQESCPHSQASLPEPIKCLLWAPLTFGIWSDLPPPPVNSRVFQVKRDVTQVRWLSTVLVLSDACSCHKLKRSLGVPHKQADHLQSVEKVTQALPKACSGWLGSVEWHGRGSAGLATTQLRLWLCNTRKMLASQEDFPHHVLPFASAPLTKASITASTSGTAIFGLWHKPREWKASWKPAQLDLTLQEHTEHLSSLRVHTCPFRLKPPSWGQSPVHDGPDGQRQSNPPARFTQAESFQQVWVFKAHSSISAKQQT